MGLSCDGGIFRNRARGGGSGRSDRFPGGAAIRAVAALIADFPNRSATPRDSGTIATRLVTPLPCGPALKIAAPRVRIGGRQMIVRPRAFVQAILYLTFVASGEDW